MLPEQFDEVSVLFSDIPVFKSIVASCSPLVIVSLLHQIYSAIDAIIPKFDVYKVETITDSYMVRNAANGSTYYAHMKEQSKYGLLLIHPHCRKTYTLIFDEKNEVE